MLSRSAFSYFKKFAFFSCSQFRNRNFQLLNHKSSIIQHNLCSTNAKEDKLISLDEINTFELSHLNCDKEKLSQIIHEILDRKREGKKIPRYVKQREFKDLIECESFNQRKKYLKYLFKKEMIKQNETEKKLQKKAELQSKIPKSLPETNHIQYGLGKNSMVLRTWKRSFLKFYDKRMANSVLFGQKIVIDLGYDKYMTNKERKGCASQVRLLYNSNKLSPDPFDLYFCNANPNSRCVQYLYELIPRLKESLVTQTEKSYLDFFPKEDLVYLSPHATETLKTYDHKAVYIIGGFVDTVKRDPVSLCKAEEEGIKSYSLPLQEYVMWGMGSKSLSINQVFSIMQTFRDTGDWREAFKHIPTRKLRRVNADSAETQCLSDKLYVMAN